MSTDNFRAIALLAFLFHSSLTTPAHSERSEEIWPGKDWDTARPADVGLDPAPLGELVSKARDGEFRGLHSLLMVKDGRLVVEEYFMGRQARDPHMMQSVTKSVMAILIGMAQKRGLIEDLSAPVVSFFPEYEQLENLDDRKKRWSLEDLLSMRSGLAWDEERDNGWINRNHVDWYKFILEKPHETDPGQRFRYNSGNAILLGGIIRNVTGLDTKQFSWRYLFDPLQMSKRKSWLGFAASRESPDLDWAYGKGNGLMHTGGAVNLTSQDALKIGYLMLREGVWRGERLISKAYFEKMVTVHTVLGRMAKDLPLLGYGYMWWAMPLERTGTLEPGQRAEVNYAAGYRGQYIFVVPRYDIVAVFTGGGRGFEQESRPLYWIHDYILSSAQSVE